MVRILTRGRWWLPLVALTVIAAGCSGAGGQDNTHDVAPGSGTLAATAPTGDAATSASTITSTPPPITRTVTPTTVTVTPTDPTLVPPPDPTPEPEPTVGTCPYLSAADAGLLNGQRVGRTIVIAVEPYPICEFYRPDGTVMAVTRVIVADSPASAAAAVNAHVPVDESFPVSKPDGWTGGAMGQQHGVGDYPDGRSIYGVSKGDIAVIAISNQRESIKGRQMVTAVIDNLGL